MGKQDLFIGIFPVFIAYFSIGVLGPVVQSIVSLTSSLRGKLVKCFTTI